MKKISHHLYCYLPYYLIGLVVIFNLALYFTNQLPIDKFFDSDCIYLPTLYRDLFINHGSYADWYGSAAPYYFPDMMLYFISNSIVEDFYYAIPLFFTINTLIIIVILYKINRHFFPPHHALYLSAISFAIIYLIPSETYIMQFTSVFHFGEFIMGLVSIYFMLNIFEDDSTIKNYLFLFLISLLTTTSDSMYILHFILPTIFTLLILWSARIVNHRQLLLLLGLFVLSIFLARVLYHLLTINYSDYVKMMTLSLEHLIINIKSIIGIFKTSYTQHTFISIVTLLLYIIIILLLFFYPRVNGLKIKKNEQPKILYLSLFLLLMMVGNLVATSLLYPQYIYIHYLIPIFLLPIFLLPMVIKWTKLYRYKKSFQIFNLSAVVLLIALLLFQSYQKLSTATIKSDYYPPLVACVDSFVSETGAKDGIAGFWESKSISMLSKHGVNIAQFNHDLTPFKAVNSIAWYRDRYDFALIKNNALDKNKIIQLNGEPTKIFQCDQSEILYYKNRLSVQR